MRWKLKKDWSVYSRARFEAGEVDTLRAAFLARSSTSGPAASDLEKGKDGSKAVAAPRLEKAKLREVLDDVPGYEKISGRAVEYVLNEAGFDKQSEFEFDEFVEICGELKEVTLRPVNQRVKIERRRIPVEKSGGGV
ncbi:hypothetical protein BD410DRAFT_893336 [Rickenella mellea]|uniref:Uncharacterized protein n=1 Tax=Rickenella mellea TaxID=50990 RepID=A0A4V3AZS2_9AGAM|nr:hypothetical protein BD410DRAFT_893336 [Rickenella mellea]